ncbi:MAG: hypothetical protein K2O03_03695, partial [Lachnospiraceae bacterium]|nr:hypothetical protein [Lachnospiraceae bacterium]
MANKKNHVSPGEERLNLGISLQKRNPLFSRLKGYVQVLNKQNMGKDAAYVHSSGTIYLNKDALLSPEQWAYTLAHCKLHLAFGHFDAERMPGYEKPRPDGSSEWVVSCNKEVWNIACDIYIAKFLRDIKFGSPTCENPADFFPGSLTDERKIYQYLMERGHGGDGAGDKKTASGKAARSTVGGLSSGYGTAEGMDMQGLGHPLLY